MSDFRLKVFYAVAKNLSFTKASQELFVSQPAITKHIHELESLYQVRLFNRLGNKISLTEAGRVLLEYSERILAEYRRLDYSMHLLHNEYSGQLRLGASTTIAQYVLPPILAEYTRQYPKIKLTLIETNSRNVEQALQEHSIDLGMVEGVFRLPNLRYEAFLCDELVPVSSIQEGGELEEEISFEEFRQIPLILRERGSGTLDAIEAVLAEKGVKLSSLNVRMHLGSTEGIKSFLKHSPCLGIVSIFAIRRELEENVFRITDIAGLRSSVSSVSCLSKGRKMERHLISFILFSVICRNTGFPDA